VWSPLARHLCYRSPWFLVLCGLLWPGISATVPHSFWYCVVFSGQASLLPFPIASGIVWYPLARHLCYRSP
jgi:hypothetical protein